jgi:predicted secreted protein
MNPDLRSFIRDIVAPVVLTGAFFALCIVAGIDLHDAMSQAVAR